MTLHRKLVSVRVIATAFQCVHVPSTVFVVRIVDFVWRL